MKVLTINNYHHIRGGSETMYLETARLLEGMGHQVLYFSTKSEKNQAHGDSSEFIEAKNFQAHDSLWKKIKFTASFIFNFEARRKLTTLIKRERPDIAHLHIYYGHMSSSILPVLKRLKIPIVLSIHEYRLLCPAYTMVNGKGEVCHECKPFKYEPCVRYNCIKGSKILSCAIALECWIRDTWFSPLKYVSQFLFVSDFAQQIHERTLPELPKSASTVLKNFIPSDGLLAEPRRGGYFMYVGRLSGEKGLPTLLKAFETFEQKLIIVGDGPIRKELEEVAPPNVEFLGSMDREKVVALMRDMSFLIIPSEWYENNPMVVIEALSVGKPVIGANIGGIPELIDGNGFLFESRSVESLVRVLHEADSVDEEAYAAMCQRSRVMYEQGHSSAQYAEKLVKIYHKVLAN